MEHTWQSLLDELVHVRNAEYRTDNERTETIIDSLDWIVQTILEKLRDVFTLGFVQRHAVPLVRPAGSHRLHLWLGASRTL